MNTEQKIIFIGAGVMASAILNNLLSEKILSSGNVFCLDKDFEKEKECINKFGLKKIKDLKEGVALADIMFLCVKPQDFFNLLKQISLLEYKKKLFVSIAAGIPIISIEKVLKDAKIIRVMPNILLSQKHGVSALTKNQRVSDIEFNQIINIFASSGLSFAIEEEKMDLITAISGSGPGYIFYFAEALLEAAVQNGLPINLAKDIIANTFTGAGLMMEKETVSFEELRKRVTSKGGTTEKAIDLMEQNEVKQIIKNAVSTAENRAKELSRLI